MKAILILLLAFAPFEFLEPEAPAQEEIKEDVVIEEVEDSKKAILYFTASWCGPCQKFKRGELPKLEKMGLDFSDGQDKLKAEIEIYDVDEDRKTYGQWKKNSRYIPMFVFLNEDGIEYARFEGFRTAEDLFKGWNQE